MITLIAALCIRRLVRICLKNCIYFLEDVLKSNFHSRTYLCWSRSGSTDSQICFFPEWAWTVGSFCYFCVVSVRMCLWPRAISKYGNNINGGDKKYWHLWHNKFNQLINNFNTVFSMSLFNWNPTYFTPTKLHSYIHLLLHMMSTYFTH